MATTHIAYVPKALTMTHARGSVSNLEVRLDLGEVYHAVLQQMIVGFQTLKGSSRSMYPNACWKRLAWFNLAKTIEQRLQGINAAGEERVRALIMTGGLMVDLTAFVYEIDG